MKWTALFQYLLLAPDSPEPKEGERLLLIEHGQEGYGTASESQPVQNDDNKIKEAINRALLSPPFLTVLVASALAFVSNPPDITSRAASYNYHKLTKT